MKPTPVSSLLDAFHALTDPRKRRGVRHPFAAILALTFLGLLCRKSDFATIARWARSHWALPRPALGFTRAYAPHATTLSRSAAAFSLDEFRAALVAWLAPLLAGSGDLTAAVDGKTSKQGLDADGDPVHMLNVFLHDLRICVASWPVGPEKATEPDTLKARLGELLADYPALKLLTGDAIFCQRPLAQAITDAGRDYLLAVKDNQPDLREAAEAAFAGESRATADAKSVEKKAGRW